MKSGMFVIGLFLILNSAGCAGTKECLRGFMGISTKVLEDNRASALVKSFNYDYVTCYNKALDILKESGSYVYAGDISKYMVAVYLSEEDTTPVGIFFTETDENNTRVEVSSPSTYGKEVIAARVFSGLGKLSSSEKE